jgi:hypothetical protein
MLTSFHEDKRVSGHRLAGLCRRWQVEGYKQNRRDDAGNVHVVHGGDCDA